MIRCDVLIVGGGPAGSTCARDLVRAGLDVVVIDKARFPRDKCCAGWITPQVVAALSLDLAEYARTRTLQAVTGFQTGAIGGPEVRTEFGEPISYAIRRCEFDDYLLRSSGARLETSVAVGAVRRDGNRWIVADRVEARMLVGAGGHFCPVARMLSPAAHDGPVILAQEIEVELPPDQAESSSADARCPELYFCADRRGYGWRVRKGEFLNVGFGHLRDERFPARVAAFAAFLRDRDKLPAAVPARWPGHAYRLHARPARPLFDDGVLLAGDAAGLAHPVSGEGILAAVDSGRLAALAIRLADGHYSRARLGAYAASIESRFGRPSHPAGHGWPLPARLVDHLSARALASPWFTRHVLLERWFLHRHLPPLIA